MKIQLCDVYYDGKLNTVAVPFKTTQQLKITVVSSQANSLVYVKGHCGAQNIEKWQEFKNSFRSVFYWKGTK